MSPASSGREHLSAPVKIFPVETEGLEKAILRNLDIRSEIVDRLSIRVQGNQACIEERNHPFDTQALSKKGIQMGNRLRKPDRNLDKPFLRLRFSCSCSSRYRHRFLLHHQHRFGCTAGREYPE